MYPPLSLSSSQPASPPSFPSAWWRWRQQQRCTAFTLRLQCDSENFAKLSYECNRSSSNQHLWDSSLIARAFYSQVVKKAVRIFMVMVLARIFSKLNMADLNFFLKRHTEQEIMVGAWFGEFCSCCCLPLLPQLACSILRTTYQPLFPALYVF